MSANPPVEDPVILAYIGGVIKGVITEVRGRCGRRSIARGVPSFGFFVNLLLGRGVSQGDEDFLGESKGVGIGSVGSMRTMGRMRRRRWHCWGRTPSSMRAEAVGMTRCDAEAFGALIKATFLLLVTLLSTEETGVVIPRMGRGKDRVGLIVECFASSSEFSGLLGSSLGEPFLHGDGRGNRLQAKGLDTR